MCIRDSQKERFESTAVPAIDAMANHGGAASLSDSSTGVGGSVVDTDNLVNVAKGPRDHRTDGFLFVVHWHARYDMRFRPTALHPSLRHGVPSLMFYICLIKNKTRFLLDGCPIALDQLGSVVLLGEKDGGRGLRYLSRAVA